MYQLISMRFLKFGIPVILVALAACKKTTFETKPGLSLVSVSDREYSPATPADLTPPLVLTFEFTDAEGDIANAMVGVQKISADCGVGNFIDTLSYAVSPEVPATKNIKGNLEVRFTYFQVARCNFADTTEFKVWIRDQAGNVSDTVSTGQIVILP